MQFNVTSQVQTFFGGLEPGIGALSGGKVSGIARLQRSCSFLQGRTAARQLVDGSMMLRL
jgi:hypothetical protein